VCEHILTNVRLEAAGSKFFAPCIVKEGYNLGLKALVDTGATVTMVRGDICHNLSLVRFGRRPVTCVHGSHADAVVQRYLCAIDLGGRERRLVIYELGNVEEGGNAIDAILGLDMLEGCRMELDWVRMEGVLEV